MRVALSVSSFVLVGLALAMPASSQTTRVSLGPPVATNERSPVNDPGRADSITDQAQPRHGIEASSLPTFGMLFPYPGIDNTFVGPAFVGGGEDNQATGQWSSVGGGTGNQAGGDKSTVSGGNWNTASKIAATVGGGTGNQAGGSLATVAGGNWNQASGDWSAIGGGDSNTASGGPFQVGGYYSTFEYGGPATIAGGKGNRATGSGSAIGGGVYNRASGSGFAYYEPYQYGSGSAYYYGGPATVAGGSENGASGSASTVGGGKRNVASGYGSTVGGGGGNSAGGYYYYGGNTASGRGATVPGGNGNVAQGDYSFAAGRLAMAYHDGAFVWGDSQTRGKTSSAADEFNVYASGGVRLFTNSAATVGAALAPGSGTWSLLSDRDSKENVAPVDARSVLDAVVAMPVSTWNYKEQDDAVRHMGPMAQDFHAAFGLGVSDTLIDSVDADGVALAAIQGLNAKLEAENARLREELSDLRARIDSLASSRSSP